SDERGQPRPHRVQRPRVAQVAEVRERYRTVREDAWRRSPAEGGRRRGERAVVRYEQDQAPADERRRRRNDEHGSPMLDRDGPADEMRKRRAQRQRADEDTDRESSPFEIGRAHV